MAEPRYHEASSPLPRQHSNPLPDSSTSAQLQRIRMRSMNSFPAAPPNHPSVSASVSSTPSSDSANRAPLPSRSTEVFSRFQRKFRQEEELPGTPFQRSGDAEDTDGSAMHSQPGSNLSRADAAASSSRKEVSVFTNGKDASSRTLSKEAPMTEEQLANLTKDERERLEWQAMLSSVLEGEVFRSEKTRIVVALDQINPHKDARQDIWLGIRAWLRGRTVKDERTLLTERRERVIGAVQSELMTFRVKDGPDPVTGELYPTPIDQVTHFLDRFDVAASLYPSLRAMALDNPQYLTPEQRPLARARLEALVSWSKLHYMLHQQLESLRRWTGSPTLDIKQPIIPADVGVVGEAAPHGELTTFVDRILKEDSLHRTFEKGTLLTLHALIETARDIVINQSPTFEALNLPRFEDELVQLIAFPTKLIKASLQMRLQSARRVKDPNLMVLETMTEDFRLTIALACTLKREYELQMEGDPAGHWTLPPCIPPKYDSVLLESVLLFFKLLHWRLKSGTKAIYFKETDVLEAQEDIMDEVSMTIESGASLVAEQLCGITNRLISRVTGYYVSQIRLPTASSKDAPPSSPRRGYVPEDYTETLNEREEAVSWLAKVLESVRQRFRKIQRYARSLHLRFSNSAEYTLNGVVLSEFINRLVATGHFLVYTDRYEQEGLYFLASESLRGRPFVIRDMLVKAFNLDRRETDVSHTSGSYAEAELDDDDHDPAYLLVLAPNEPFVWNGLIMPLSLPQIDLSMYAQRIRLVADGSQTRLLAAKKLFAAAMTSSSVFLAPPSADAMSPESEDESPRILLPPVNLTCVHEQQAHLPSVDRELQKISKGITKLAETIVGSVDEVKRSIHGSEQYQELLENWFTFAADHGQHAEKHIDSVTETKYSQMFTKLAITWLSFICDECDPTDRKTFRWAVTALEFAMSRTEGSTILKLAPRDFTVLRQKVASCMTLLISHFDILGARSSTEAARMAEESRKSAARMMRDDTRPTSPVTETGVENSSLRLKWQDSLQRLQSIDERRMEAEAERHAIGRVVDEEKLEDKSLLFLASSTSNISVRWQQGKFIGAGAFGSVYLAVNLDSGAMMAAKEIRFQDVNSLSTLFEQIKDELSVMEMLQHPYIVEYYGIEVHRDKVFIFEEYCEGGSLASLLEHGRIEDETVLQVYTMQMLEGLAYLHSKGVVHRDIKPENVLLNHMGIVKIVDFGASKIIVKGQQKTLARATRNQKSKVDTTVESSLPHNSLTGTPMYMSPEIIRNDKRGRQGAMDIWSLGCVVLECATGRKPWNSAFDNEWAIMFQIGQGNRIPQLPEAWQLSQMGISFLRQCFILDPNQRPSSEELLNHPWMQSLRAELTAGDPQPLTPGVDEVPQTPEPQIAHQAHIMEKQQIDEMIYSPSGEDPFTPRVLP